MTQSKMISTRIGSPRATAERSTRIAHSWRATLIVAAGALGLSLAGCGALLLVGGAGTSAIAFATGELRSTEEGSIAELDQAVEAAIEDLGYSEIKSERKADRVRWQAMTPGGDPVDVRLAARGPERTTLRIRVGVFGNETRSRLILEQVRLSM